MNLFILMLFWLPVVSGLILVAFPKKLKKISVISAFLIMSLIFYFQILVFIKRPFLGNNFAIDNLNGFILIFLGFFSLITAVYSRSYFSSGFSKFYGYVLLTLGASNFTVLTNNLLYLLVSWGFLGITLYFLINFFSPESVAASKKTFIIVGGSDAFLLLGIAILWCLSKSFNFDKIASLLPSLKEHSGLINISFICFVIAAFAKAGAFPLHTWIPEISSTTSIPTLGFMPASLDKLLGIYLLTRVMIDIFKIPSTHWLALLLVFLGAFTVISAVMMALIQHNVRKLLSYHAVSQVGYMVMGIGTMHPIGILGGLFHMLNHAIYKMCLFLSAGNVEKQTKTMELDKLGGLAHFMPLTFTTMLIAAFAISGVPPLNGFYSKWMIYQGTLLRLTDSSLPFFARIVYVISIVFALLGSALTLASFLKVIFGIFLGQSSKICKGIKEASKTMLIPVVLLASLCIFFGLSGRTFVLKYLINPLEIKTEYGLWLPQIATILILFGITLGIVVFVISKAKVRLSNSFIGGEHLSDDVRPLATEFYNQIEKMGFLSVMYKLAERKVFDLYEICTKITFAFIRFLRYLHNGVLPTYLVWCLIGIVILLFKLLK